MHPPFLTLRRFYLFRKITIRFIFRTEYCNEDYTYDDTYDDTYEYTYEYTYTYDK